MTSWRQPPAGRPALFYTFKNKHFIKMGWTAWRDFLPTIDDEYRFSGPVGSRQNSIGLVR